MTTIEQSRREQIDQVAARAWSGTAGLFGGLFAALGAGLRGLGELRAGVTAAPAARASGGQISEVFSRALCDDSNSAMDWLYYAAQLSDPEERSYCARKARQIDPTSEIVRAELRRLR